MHGWGLLLDQTEYHLIYSAQYKWDCGDISNVHIIDNENKIDTYFTDLFYTSGKNETHCAGRTRYPFRQVFASGLKL